jgi:hypothetical protein
VTAHNPAAGNAGGRTSGISRVAVRPGTTRPATAQQIEYVDGRRCPTGLFSRLLQDPDKALCGAQHILSRAVLRRTIERKTRLLNRHGADGTHYSDKPFTLSIRHGHSAVPPCSPGNRPPSLSQLIASKLQRDSTYADTARGQVKHSLAVRRTHHSSPAASSEALPPVAAVLTATVCSFANRRR